ASRIDALAAAARLVLGVEALGRELATDTAHFAATVGEFEMLPNAANVVPSRVRLLIDARAELRPDMQRFIAGIAELAARAGQADVAASGGEFEVVHKGALVRPSRRRRLIDAPTDLGLAMHRFITAIVHLVAPAARESGVATVQPFTRPGHLAPSLATVVLDN